jgi:hypothetical protein
MGPDTSPPPVHDAWMGHRYQLVHDAWMAPDTSPPPVHGAWMAPDSSPPPVHDAWMGPDTSPHQCTMHGWAQTAAPNKCTMHKWAPDLCDPVSSRVATHDQRHSAVCRDGGTRQHAQALQSLVPCESHTVQQRADLRLAARSFLPGGATGDPGSRAGPRGEGQEGQGMDGSLIGPLCG